MPKIKRIVLVGHCGFDSGSLRSLAQQAAPDAEVSMVNDDASLQQVANSDSLLLVNRVLDGRFSTGSGVALISELAKGENPPAMMLVSNYADAQEQAVAAGALQGFGKGEMYQPEVADRLKAAVS